jgi:hypothetical protein
MKEGALAAAAHPATALELETRAAVWAEPDRPCSAARARLSAEPDRILEELGKLSAEPVKLSAEPGRP